SWITYADRLMEFPSALLGVALGTVLLPSLAQHHSESNHEQYSPLLDWGVRLAFLLALPAAVALWLLALPLVSTLYQYGKCTADDACQTRAAALAVLGAVLFWLAGAPAFWLGAGLWSKVGRLAAVVGAGIVVYFATLYLLGFRFEDFNRRESASTLP